MTASAYILDIPEAIEAKAVEALTFFGPDDSGIRHFINDLTALERHELAVLFAGSVLRKLTPTEAAQACLDVPDTVDACASGQDDARAT